MGRILVLFLIKRTFGSICLEVPQNQTQTTTNYKIFQQAAKSTNNCNSLWTCSSLLSTIYFCHFRMFPRTLRSLKSNLTCTYSQIKGKESFNRAIIQVCRNYGFTQWNCVIYEVYEVSENKYCCSTPFTRPNRKAFHRNCFIGLCSSCSN